MPPDEKPDLDAHLRRFGLSAFRSRQRDVISTVLAGRDCLCVMPTGEGKSLCYQLPGMILPALTLVVSPLIALMKDQVDQLQALGLPVTFINSTLSLTEQYARLDDMAAGRYRLVYVVPERFRSPRFLEAVRAVGLQLLAVDEAHCISEWGHDFRPDYARLGKFRRMLGLPPTIALTATATDAVRRDIVEQLDLRDPQTFITGFARPNLRYKVLSPRTEGEKTRRLLDFLRKTPGSGIIYTATRKRSEEVAQSVNDELGRRTVAYHAGMLGDQRHKAQDAFMEGRVEIVVATNAFGMGIDKPDVRFVVHYNLPGTLEAYYQEAGRAGRDGDPSQCLLLYSAVDRRIQEYFIESDYPDREYVARVYGFLRGVQSDPIEVTQQEIKEQLQLPIATEGVGACERILESAGVLERLVAGKNMASIRLDSDLPTLVDLLPKQATVRRRVLRAVERMVGPRRHEMVHFHLRALLKDAESDHDALTHALRELNDLSGFTYVPPFRGRAIRMIRRDQEFAQLGIDFEALSRRKQTEYDKLAKVEQFARTDRCRQEEILRYFGEDIPQPCGHCDNCAKRQAVVQQSLPSPVAGERQAAVPRSLPSPVTGEGPGVREGRGQSVKSLTDGRRMPAARPTAKQELVPVTPGLLTGVRIVLSGVARTQSRVRCGKNLIAQMLCGSASARMKQLGLNRLSTFGLLEHLKQTDVVALIEALIATKHLEQVPIAANRAVPHAIRSVLQLTPAGTDVMKGKAALAEGFPIPPLLASKFAGVVSSRLPLQPGAPTDRAVPRSPAHSDHYWTWRLLSAGFHADECVVIRGLDRRAILDHAIRALDDGWPVRSGSCLSRELIAALDGVQWSGDAAEARSIPPDLPPGTTQQEVDLFLKCRAQRPVE